MYTSLLCRNQIAGQRLSFIFVDWIACRDIFTVEYARFNILILITINTNDEKKPGSINLDRVFYYISILISNKSGGPFNTFFLNKALLDGLIFLRLIVVAKWHMIRIMALHNSSD